VGASAVNVNTSITIHLTTKKGGNDERAQRENYRTKSPGGITCCGEGAITRGWGIGVKR